MNNISICFTTKNRAPLLKYNLEGLSRQDFLDEGGQIEICIMDRGSTDNLLGLIDRYSEVFTFRFAEADPFAGKMSSKTNPCINFNTLIKYIPTNNYVIKTDAEVVVRDPWTVREIFEALEKDDSRMYNARTHFTDSDGWYSDFDELLSKYERHYLYAEGGPFSRSKYYFFSGFSREKFIELGGIDELFSYGVGYDDTALREMWKNRYGQYEKEISGQAIHQWHGPNVFPPPWEEMNRRIYERIKGFDKANMLALENGKVVKRERPCGFVEMLSRIYTIKDGSVINTETPWEGAREIDLPF
jgi:glycosyltransferase involved in cell wall biosynthesis